ncbi:MAG: RS21-C6 protein [Candidatus Moranbacteria bacterium]|nr:RS21-C6 protein [Candidatus Moranbacteria bacterium]
MPKLKPNPKLQDFQNYVKEMVKERGFTNNKLETFLLFSEEVGELAKAIRNYKNLYQEKNSRTKKFKLSDEFADVLIYLLDLANQFEIDLEKAFRRKEQKNKKRAWIN